MDTHNDWDRYAYAINYTCASYDVGISLAEIHCYLRSNGYPTLEFSTIEEWLRANGRSVNSLTAQATGSRLANIRPVPITAPPAPNPVSSRGGATTRLTRTMPPNVPWDPQADRLPISAHREGKTVERIRQELSLNGYNATLNDVIRSLNKQGINHFKC